MADNSALFPGDITSSEFQNSLKRRYEDRARYNLKSTAHPLMYIMGEKNQLTGGESHTYDSIIGEAGGVGGQADSTLRSGVFMSSNLEQLFTFNVTNQLGQFEVGDKEGRLSVGTKNAFLSHFENKMTGHVKALKSNATRQLFGTRTGLITTVVDGVHTVDTGQLTIKVANPDRIARGNDVQIVTVDPGTGAVAYVDAIGETNGFKILTVAASTAVPGEYDVVIKSHGSTTNVSINIPINAHIIIVGALDDIANINTGNPTQTNHKWNENNGVEDYFINVESIIGGVDRSLAEKSWLKPVTKDLAAGDLDDDAISKVADAAATESENGIELLFAKAEVVRNYELSLVDQKRFVVTGTNWESYAGSYSMDTISYAGMPMVKERFVTPDTLFGTAAKGIWDKLTLDGGFRFLQINGSIFHWNQGYYTNVLTAEYCQIANINPNAAFTITNIGATRA